MIDKYNLKSKTVLVFDFGSQVAVAQRLSRDFGRVLYYIPSVINGFKDHKAHSIGRGISGIERVDDFWGYIHEIDLVVFTDIYEGPLQDYLRFIGKPIFGGGRASELESERLKFKELIAAIGLNVNHYDVAFGLTELDKKLQSAENKFIKSKLRGDMETFHHTNYTLSQTELRRMKHDMGVYAEKETYIIESPIEAIAECYDKETEVLTKDGWVLFKDVKYSDLIATMNPISKKLEYQHPINIIKRYSKDICYIKAQKIDFAVTENHNMALVRANNRRIGIDKIELIKVSDISNGQFTIINSCVWEGEEKLFFNIGERKLSMDMWLNFLGWFMSDGCLNDYRGHEVFSISQSFSNNEQRDMIDDVLNSIGFKYNKNGSNYRIYDKEVYYELLKYGRYKKDRRVPDYIKNLSSRQIGIYLEAYWQGDGTLESNGVTKSYCIGVNEKMADDVQELIIKNGGNGAKLKKKPMGIHKYAGRIIDSKQETFIVSSHKNTNQIVTKNQIKKERYDDFVYCVNVPNHIIMVRRNGRSSWCGNCGYDGYCIDGLFPEISVSGIEIKDAGYIGKMIRYDRLPKQITEVNDKFAPILNTYGYRSAFSTEIRIDDKKDGYFIDPTLRLPEPNTALTLEMYDNYSEIIWDVANGKIPNIKWSYEWGCEFIIKSDLAKTEPIAFQFPDQYKKYIKIKNLVIDDKGVYWYVPNNVEMAEVGAVVGLGRTMELAVKMATEVANSIKGFDIKIKTDCIEDASKQIKDLRKNGINFL